MCLSAPFFLCALCGVSRSVLLALLFVCGSAIAAEAGPYHHGILFEIRPAQGADPSILLGTIHSDAPRVVNLPEPIRSRFDAAPAFVMEVVPDARAVIKSMLTMVYTDGRTLQDVLPADTYLETVEAMEEIGLPVSAFKDFKPWAAVTLLSLPRSGSGDFLDIHLYKTALEAGKTVEALETIEEQLAVFDELTEDEQIALLRETLASRQQIPEVFEQLVDAWLERDLGRLLSLSDLYLGAGDKVLAERFRRVAIDARNLRMFERMRPMLDRGGRFIAVGALHLPGTGGLLQRLVKAGFVVTPLY